MAVIIDGTGTITGLDADGISSQPVFPGNVLQVVSTTKTETFSESVAGEALSGDITGLTSVITPSSTSNKILVTLTLNAGAVEGITVSFVLHCNGSEVGIGDSAGSRSRVSGRSSANTNITNMNVSFSFLHLPNSTTQQTYSVRLKHNSSIARTIFVNRDATDTDAHFSHRAISTITLMEIAG